MTEPHRKPDWKRGLRALRQLLDDPDSTHHAFEVIEALDPDGDLRALARLRADPEGRRLLAERPSLLDGLRDREALAMYKKVIALNPLFCPAYGHLRMMYELLGEKEKYAETLESALREAFPQYLSQHPDDARAHMFFAIESSEVGKIEQAKAQLARALELSPGDPFILYAAACFYARLGERRLALDALRNAVAAGYSHFEWMKRDPDLENIRNESEYMKLLRGK